MTWKDFFNSKAGIVALLVFSIAICVALGLLIRFFVRLGKLPPDTPYQPVKDNEGNVVPGADPLDGYNPMAMVETLEHVLKTSYYFDASERCEVYKDCMSLTDNQLIAVANLFKKRNTRTIREMMADTYGDGCTLYSSAYGDLLRTRMTQLGVA